MSWDNNPPSAATPPSGSYDAGAPGAKSPPAGSFDAGAPVAAVPASAAFSNGPDWALDDLAGGTLSQLDADTGAVLNTYDILGNSAISGEAITLTTDKDWSPWPSAPGEHNWILQDPDGQSYQMVDTGLNTPGSPYDGDFARLGQYTQPATPASASFNSGAPGAATPASASHDSAAPAPATPASAAFDSGAPAPATPASGAFAILPPKAADVPGNFGFHPPIGTLIGTDPLNVYAFEVTGTNEVDGVYRNSGELSSGLPIFRHVESPELEFRYGSGDWFIWDTLGPTFYWENTDGDLFDPTAYSAMSATGAAPTFSNGLYLNVSPAAATPASAAFSATPPAAASAASSSFGSYPPIETLPGTDSLTVYQFEVTGTDQVDGVYRHSGEFYGGKPIFKHILTPELEFRYDSDWVIWDSVNLTFYFDNSDEDIFNAAAYGTIGAGTGPNPTFSNGLYLKVLPATPASASFDNNPPAAMSV